MKERLRGQFCNIAAVFMKRKFPSFYRAETPCFFVRRRVGAFLCSSVSFLQKSLHFFRKMKRKIVRFAIA